MKIIHVIFLIMVVLIGLGVAHLAHRKNHPAPAPKTQVTTHPPQPVAGMVAVEAKVRSLAAGSINIQGFRPAIIYSKLRDETQERYVCVGSVRTVGGKHEIITAAHLFWLTGERTHRAEVLNEKIDTPLYLQPMNIRLLDPEGKVDAFMIELGPTPVLSRSSRQPPMDETVDYVWDIPKVGGELVNKVTSGLSGKTLEVVGWARNKQMCHYLIIDSEDGSPGESGTLYVDQATRLWILHAGPDTDKVGLEMKRDYFNRKGKYLKGVIMLSGPFAAP